MLNAFFELEAAEESLQVINCYRRTNPLYSIPHRNPVQLKKALEDQQLSSESKGAGRLYENGILVDPGHLAVLERFKGMFPDVDADVDPYALSMVLTSGYLRSEIRVIRYADVDIPFAYPATPPIKDENAPRHHLVIYSDPSELRRLHEDVDVKRRDTIFLCRVAGGEITEIGPVYALHPSFCFDCLIDRLETYHIRWTGPLPKISSAVLEEEFLRALVDHYSSYITLLSNVHERKIILSGHEIQYTSLISPRSSHCKCQKQ
ncbi:hypothetical protein KIH86_06655 [Paenibacillus sp. HN-1]|uniref:hypothetical protein n=1 Tax=Paenibacillus TaxID=44249 RepID=UPI001CA7FF7F|nr:MULTISPECIES: hypothetical protein [Paenibacillus]MBY9077979.1 hypothetical protein [Paenibacillus sp. CGMCC 1.18879]MBY9083917.1 hypothetical protein [Paenibacillus sinensis]